MISDFMQTLLDRMDKFPEEFIDVTADLSGHCYTRATEYVRWEGITKSMLYYNEAERAFSIFTEEEQAAYFSKLRGLLRKKLEQDICSALMEDSRQMELPGISARTLTTQQMTNEALKVLEKELFKQTPQIPTSILKDQ